MDLCDDPLVPPTSRRRLPDLRRGARREVPDEWELAAQHLACEAAVSVGDGEVEAGGYGDACGEGGDVSETDLKRAITSILELHGWLVTRVQSGGYRGRMRLAKKGTEDLACCAPGGIYVAVETKLPKTGRLSKEQIQRSGEVIRAGGQYVVMRSVDDAVRTANGIKELRR